MDQTSEWRPIPGYEGFYDVSDDGRIRSWWGKDHRPIPYEMRTRMNPAGYPKVNLSGPNGRRGRLVHHLVLEAFVGPRPLGTEACHYNGDQTDNHVENLRWDTRSANQQDNVRLGRWNGGNYQKRYCKRGHEFTAENTMVSRNKHHVARRCRACWIQLRDSWPSRKRAA